MPAAAAKSDASRAKEAAARHTKGAGARGSPTPSKAGAPPSRPPKPAEGEVELMVLEYLAHCGFDRAVAELKAELRERRMGRAHAWRPVGREVQPLLREKMLKAVERGERAEALKLWDNFVPPLVRRTDRDAQKLEFYLHVYFAIFPLHPVNPHPDPAATAQSMAAFKAFLETDKSQLATTPEFLAYYAMPYVPEIREHPSFTELFTEAWALALRKKLDDFLSLSHHFASEPRLAIICRSYKELAGAMPRREHEWDSHPVHEAHKAYDELKQRLLDSELRAANASQGAATDCAALARLASDAAQLTEEALRALHAAAAPAEQLEAMERRLLAVRRRLGARGGGAEGGGGGGGGVGGVGGGGGGGGGRPAAVSLGASMRTMAPLDFAKLRLSLLRHAADAPLLLQALRWRITKPPRRQRRAALLQLIQAGLLEPEVIASLLGQEASGELREQALRLINLFASESIGRSYLISQGGLVPQLCEVLTHEPSDSVARQNALGALQKLSLRRQPQNAMIDNDIIAWLVHVLSDVDSLSEYSVEYGTALLMNLSLRSAGKDKCADPTLDTLSVLSQLMESDSMQVRTYVNGTLYSILVSTPLKERAQEIGLADSLRALIEHSDETFARQINYILERLESLPAEGEAVSDGEDDADEEDVEEEAEEEEEEEEEADAFPESELPLGDGVAAGEELLSMRYLADVSDAQQQDARLRASIDEEAERKRQAAAAGGEAAAAANPHAPPARRRHHPDEPLQRPTTPALLQTAHDWERGELPPGATPLPAEAEEAGGKAGEEGGEGGGAWGEAAEAAEAAELGGSSYPAPEEVDAASPTIAVRHRLARTPQQKTRGEASELKPTAARPRARVEPVKRTSQKSQPPAAPPPAKKQEPPRGVPPPP
ncbi:hypothetical protein AB1Y20_018438 [Prymnesium parvum]|uniref:LisH domain-containing protein ARMC9 n=1 Tax=Prymnesium parvum TaxID=97485 RepID=A0AB34JNC5_PRYPA